MTIDIQNFEELKKVAESGDNAACIAVGKMYLAGNGTEKDDYQAFEYFKKAADNNYASAFAWLGMMYYYGRGTEQNYSESFQCFQKAVTSENISVVADSAYKLSEMYYGGLGVTENVSEAFKWLQKSADLQNVDAMGKVYYSGELTGRHEHTEAFKWFKKALDAGSDDIEVCVFLGHLYISGYGGEKNPEEGLRLLRKADERGYILATFQIANYYFHEDNYAESFKWFKKIAETTAQSSKDIDCKAMAMNALGTHYENGFSVKKDYLEALKWYKKAVENGYADAQKRIDILNSQMNKVTSTVSISSLESNTPLNTNTKKNHSIKDNIIAACSVFGSWIVFGFIFDAILTPIFGSTISWILSMIVCFVVGCVIASKLI